jgi:hypothetical protein
MAGPSDGGLPWKGKAAGMVVLEGVSSAQASARTPTLVGQRMISHPLGEPIRAALRDSSVLVRPRADGAGTAATPSLGHLHDDRNEEETKREKKNWRRDIRMVSSAGRSSVLTPWCTLS